MENIQKHLGLFLDPKLNLFDQVKKIKMILKELVL